MFWKIAGSYLLGAILVWIVATTIHFRRHTYDPVVEGLLMALFWPVSVPAWVGVEFHSWLQGRRLRGKH